MRGLHVKCPIFLFEFNQIWSISTDFHKVLNIKFHVNLSGGSRANTFRQTDGRTDVTKVIDAFRDCANAPNKTYTFTCGCEYQTSDADKQESCYSMIYYRVSFQTPPPGVIYSFFFFRL
jgi:hypothetical protein